MHLVSCQLLKKFVIVFFLGFNNTPKKTLQSESITTMRNGFNFWKNICQVKYAVFRDLGL